MVEGRTELRSLPTELNGRTYRSLLEAKWASFLTDIGWEYEYEPGSFNGWLPDFAIRPPHPTGKTLYIEVKPTFDFPEEAAQKAISAVVNNELSDLTDNMLSAVTRGRVNRAIARAFKQTEILIVGYRPMVIDDKLGIGWITKPDANKIVDEIRMVDEGSRYIFKVMEAAPLWPNFFMGETDLINIWNHAANKVQWNPVDSVGLTFNGEPL